MCRVGDGQVDSAQAEEYKYPIVNKKCDIYTSMGGKKMSSDWRNKEIQEFIVVAVDVELV